MKSRQIDTSKINTNNQSNLQYRSLIIFSLLLVGLVGSGGCLTAMMWGTMPQSKETIVHNESMGNDQVVAFGQASADSSQMQKGSLIMMGQKYWYVLPPAPSSELLNLLKADLPRAYTIAEVDTPDILTTEPSNSRFPVEILEDEGAFSSEFCLHYEATTTNEVNTLKRLNFKAKTSRIYENNKQFAGSAHYQRCLSTQGQYFTTNNRDAGQYRFTTPVPVSLFTRHEQTYRKTRVSGVISSVLLTPMTLSLDAISSVIFLPIMISLQ